MHLVVEISGWNHGGREDRGVCTKIAARQVTQFIQ